MTQDRITPNLLFADDKGEIFDDPDLLMLCRRGKEFTLPRPDDLIPLPPESELFLLPKRHALGLEPDSGEIQSLDEYAVAAFIAPGHTISAHPAYVTASDAPTLPLFAYGAVGIHNDKFYVCARKVDDDRRQIFTSVNPEKIQRGARDLMANYPKNRLIKHLMGCALGSCCPAARNLALGRFEAPLPTSRVCNAACLGCISLQPEDSGFPSTQKRITFKPRPAEIAEIMTIHAAREKRPIFSFGQGCEGEPLTEAELIAEAVRRYRSKGGVGTVNINTNASLPQFWPDLAAAGVNSLRVSLNSVRPEFYHAYYRPKGYTFDSVLESIGQAKSLNLHVSLNYLFFPGVSDTEAECQALCDLLVAYKPDLIQMRNLNLDPELYLRSLPPIDSGPSMGLTNFMKRLKKTAPDVKFGYFNPYLGEAE